jgi:hypothetical protein
MFKTRSLPNGWVQTYEVDKDGNEITGRLWNMFPTQEAADIEIKRLNAPRQLKMKIKNLIAILIGLTALCSQGVFAQTLGATNTYAVLGASTVTNTGSSVINGDLGLYPGTSATGFPPGVLNGFSNINNSSATQAQTDLVTAYNSLSGATDTIPVELGGTTLDAGSYGQGTFGINGTLILDGQGNPNATFIFDAASTLITGGASNISLINGAQACNVFWQVGSSATLGANSSFVGTIIAAVSITATTGATIQGRLLAQTGAVTLDTNTINVPTCLTSTSTPPIATSTPPIISTSTPPIATTTTPVSTSTPIVNISVPASYPPVYPPYENANNVNSTPTSTSSVVATSTDIMISASTATTSLKQELSLMYRLLGLLFRLQNQLKYPSVQINGKG